MPLRHPLEAAIQARSVAVVTNQPVVTGFGPGAVALQDSLLGRRYGSQLTAVREFATLVRAFLDGEPVAQDGDYFSFHGDLTPTPAPRVDLGLGVLRPAMARVAGEVADVAITWLTPASYLRNQIVPALRAADRRPRLVATVPLALRQPDRDPAQLADTVHLRVPHYVDMLRKAGVDTSDVARAAVDAGAFVYGDPDEIAKQLTEFAEAGVDEIVLSVTGVCLRHGPKAALAELEAILSAVLP
jgi:alkanesulfonate monooxygenase SsuD/methylene tetrahydromethanopterin reductase-like flavin-dependent oxidoreductase (luciferase family)